MSRVKSVGLRLSALDSQDLEAISALVQDSLLKVGDVAYDAPGRRLALRVNRYRWEQKRRLGRAGERVQSLILIENALAVKSARVRLGDPQAVASLLALRFEPAREPPGGALRLILAGGGEIRAEVEALDLTVTDVSLPWAAARRPSHEGAQ